MHQSMVSSTCAIRIPVTIASWCSVPSAPRRLVGAISPTYMGVKPEANPIPPNKRKQWDDERDTCRGNGDDLLRLHAGIWLEERGADHSRPRWPSDPGPSFQRSGIAWTSPSNSLRWRQTSCLWAWLSSWENTYKYTFVGCCFFYIIFKNVLRSVKDSHKLRSDSEL